MTAGRRPICSSIINLFRDLRPGLEQTKVFVETLLALKLIEPVDISLAFDDGTKRQLEGLYTINQDAAEEAGRRQDRRAVSPRLSAGRSI